MKRVLLVSALSLMFTNVYATTTFAPDPLSLISLSQGSSNQGGNHNVGNDPAHCADGTPTPGPHNVPTPGTAWLLLLGAAGIIAPMSKRHRKV